MSFDHLNWMVLVWCRENRGVAHIEDKQGPTASVEGGEKQSSDGRSTRVQERANVLAFQFSALSESVQCLRHHHLSLLVDSRLTHRNIRISQSHWCLSGSYMFSNGPPRELDKREGCGANVRPDRS